MDFIGNDFLLQNECARRLYHDHAAKMPIIDYHCHINPQEIFEDHRFATITEAWLGGDHYKWRLMRAAGLDERYITGDASAWEKFEAFASVMPRAVGNPVYEWVHLELRRYFGYEKPLSPDTAKEVYDLCNRKLAEPGFSVRGLIERSQVKLLCTTDDPADSLEWHKKIAADPTCKVKVLPAFRPDKAFNLEKSGYAAYIKSLTDPSGITICDFNALCQALMARIDYFDSLGCRASDHGLDYLVYRPITEEQADAIFKKAMLGKVPLTTEEIEGYKTTLLLCCAKAYAAHGWVMQLHYSALRNNNTPRFNQLGPDTGFDAVGSFNCAQSLSSLLDALCQENTLPRTVVYSLNPNDNSTIPSIIGCFQDIGIVNKMQHGSAWWFNDHFDGMDAQLRSLANASLLSGFIGMLTDSRSFLSYTRHEYFRRVLCNCIGGWVEQGRCPNDMELLGKLVQDISYHNTVRYFGFQV